MRLVELLNTDGYSDKIKSFLLDQILSLKSQNIKEITVDRIMGMLKASEFSDVDTNFVVDFLDEITNVGQRDGNVFKFNAGTKLGSAGQKKQKTGQDKVKDTAMKSASELIKDRA